MIAAPYPRAPPGVGGVSCIVRTLWRKCWLPCSSPRRRAKCRTRRNCVAGCKCFCRGFVYSVRLIGHRGISAHGPRSWRSQIQCVGRGRCRLFRVSLFCSFVGLVLGCFVGAAGYAVNSTARPKAAKCAVIASLINSTACAKVGILEADAYTPKRAEYLPGLQKSLPTPAIHLLPVVKSQPQGREIVATLIVCMVVCV